jgi:UDP-2,4-diacetamido-2,4,6-trideoxy-beta-L-altropyranose hydrolase
VNREPVLVALRADADTATGLGHVLRCLALAEALHAAGARTLLITRAPGPAVIERARISGVALRKLPSATTPVDDAAQTLEALGDEMPAWLVVDHYALDARWHDAIAEATAARIAAIDDLADRPMHCEVLIDHNLADNHRRKYGTRLDERAALLGGPRYALLGPMYACAPRCAPHDPVRSIGIFMGGTDPAQASTIALQACVLAGFRGKIELVSTTANARHQALATAIAQVPGAHLSLDLPDLAAFFARHDLQIGAGGGASWERCCIGPPTLAVMTAGNQRASIPALAARGAIATLPDDMPVTPSSLASALASLLADPKRRLALGRRATSLVDGHGARRVALRLLASTLRVRPATAADSALVFTWRNHPSIRALSRQAEAIDEATHQRWFDGVLGDPERALWIGVVGNLAVGVIRFDRCADHMEDVEVSLYTDPDLVGLSLGTSLLRAGERQAAKVFGDAQRFVAHVLPGNAGSRRLFEAAGYRFDATGWSRKPTFAQEPVETRA